MTNFIISTYCALVDENNRLHPSLDCYLHESSAPASEVGMDALTQLMDKFPEAGGWRHHVTKAEELSVAIIRSR